MKSREQLIQETEEILKEMDKIYTSFDYQCGSIMSRAILLILRGQAELNLFLLNNLERFEK